MYLISVCLPSGQLKDDFKWFESSLTKTERTALSHYKNTTASFSSKKVSSGTRKGTFKKMLVIFFPTVMVFVSEEVWDL